MKIRTFIIITVLVVAALTVYNLRGNLSVLSTLPDHRLHHIDAAREEAEDVPFHEREHRLERRPRLERPADHDEQGEPARDARLKDSQKSKVSRAKQASGAPLEDKYHVVASVDGGLYTEWQVRICYYHYKKMLRDFPDSAMGGFTRLLHSGEEDTLMEEIPTAVVDKLPLGLDQGFVVLNRPYGFLQWVRKFFPLIKERYILMIEPDYIFVRPPPLWATPTKSAAYHFTYMLPQDNREIIEPYNEKDVPFDTILPIGNAPTLMHRDLLASIVEDWYDIALRMKNDPKANKAFGWILEMFAFSIAASQALDGPLDFQLHGEFIVQPPFDGSFTSREGKKSYIIHYTYGNDYDEAGKMMYGKGVSQYYHWDKRDYTYEYPPGNFPLPPPEVEDETVRTLIMCINEAIAALKPWPLLPDQPLGQL
ncbi:H7M6 Hydroxyproline O-arabinosyltransferase PLENTY [Coccomyxa sp. Obi]|nr:H7M6 Hydroxyproline O-arabinosyltransferase PLENTY [Coccomyxa sp. Obi]